MNKYITRNAIKKADKINTLGMALEGSKKDEIEYVLGRLTVDSRKIRSLYRKKDPYWSIETAHLIFHSIKLLRLHSKNINKLLEKTSLEFEKILKSRLKRRQK